MKFKSIEKIHSGKFITRYDLHYETASGKPVTYEMISREPNGEFNEEYCKWCYTDGKFVYNDKSVLLDFLLSHMPNPENTPDAERRAFFDKHLSQLKHWKQV
jgi:hypothetical protein